MKSKIFILFFAFLFIGQASAQDWTQEVYKYREIYPGYVILADGKKIEGFILYENCVQLQDGVTFYLDKNDRKSKTNYKAADLKEYMVAEKTYHVIHYSGGLMSKPVKGNLLVKEGCITEYVWYTVAENASTLTRKTGESEAEFHNRLYTSTQLFKKTNEEDVRSLQYFALKFAEKMSEFVGDNKELAQKVADKEKGYGMIRIMEIIAEYNENCTK